MGLFNFWRKDDSNATAVAEPSVSESDSVPDSATTTVEQRPVSDSKPTKKASKSNKKQSKKVESQVEPVQPDPFQEVLDKLASRPEGEFVLIEHAANQFPKRILELGMDDGQRIATLLQFGTIVFPPEEILYVGLDWFDSRTPKQRLGLTYNQAKNLINSIGVKNQLQAGEPSVSILPIVNALTNKKIDWILISSEIKSKQMRTIWPLLPRILKPETKLFLEKNGEYKLLIAEEVERIAKKAETLGRK